MTSFLDLLKEKIIVFDGAMGVSLQVALTAALRRGGIVTGEGSGG